MSLSQQVVNETRVKIQAMTDVGRARAHNEDNFIVCPDLGEKRWYLSDHPELVSSRGSLLVVADGMGGANAGEIASEIAVETIKQKFNSLKLAENINEADVQDFLHQAILEAHGAIADAAAQNTTYAGMGTTLVLAWVFRHKAVIGWVGDSRAYRYRPGQGLRLLTDDHSLVWEMVKAGKLSPEQADVHPQNNIITQSLGDKTRQPQPEFTTCALEPSDRLLLCSDGLNNMLHHQSIEKILGAGAPLAETCRQLIDSANEAGGSDNVTVLLLEVLGKPVKKKYFNWFGLFPV